MIHRQWNWGNGVTPPSKVYNQKFFDRTIELLDKYSPELVYFDDTALPLWPVSDMGLKIAAHMYNKSIVRNGKLTAVINGKILDKEQRKCMVWDIERRQSNQIEPLPWQTCACLGSWHYDRRIYDRHGYKSAKNVIQMLADVVSKNGNLLLSVPIRGMVRLIVMNFWLSKRSENGWQSIKNLFMGQGPGEYLEKALRWRMPLL